MNNTMVYKGYTARIEFDPRDEIFVGRVLGIEDRITFHAAIDHYLADYAVTGRAPQKP